MNRKSKGKVLLASAGSAVLAIAMYAQTSGVHLATTANCERATMSEELSVACNQTLSEQVSWADWLVGKSRGYQFHFLDLLELLYSDNSANNDSFNSGTSSQF